MTSGSQKLLLLRAIERWPCLGKNGRLLQEGSPACKPRAPAVSSCPPRLNLEPVFNFKMSVATARGRYCTAAHATNSTARFFKIGNDDRNRQPALRLCIQRAR